MIVHSSPQQIRNQFYTTLRRACRAQPERNIVCKNNVRSLALVAGLSCSRYTFFYAVQLISPASYLQVYSSVHVVVVLHTRECNVNVMHFTKYALATR